MEKEQTAERTGMAEMLRLIRGCIALVIGYIYEI